MQCKRDLMSECLLEDAESFSSQLEVLSSSPTTSPRLPFHRSSGQKVAGTNCTGHFASFISNCDPSRKLRTAILTCFFQFRFSLKMYLILCPIKTTPQNALRFELLDKSIKCNTLFLKSDSRVALTKDEQGAR